jgi:GNAT superfamily N-acetyltransferase
MAAKEKPTDEEVLEILAVAYVNVEALRRHREARADLMFRPCSVLAPYRSLSLGSALLSNALKVASTTSTPAAAATKTAQATSGRKKATKAILHVQEGNEDAKRFYVERFGFEVEKL